jgi:hypothetical protein
VICGINKRPPHALDLADQLSVAGTTRITGAEAMPSKRLVQLIVRWARLVEEITQHSTELYKIRHAIQLSASKGQLAVIAR